MMPLTLANVGEESIVRKVSGTPVNICNYILTEWLNGLGWLHGRHRLTTVSVAVKEVFYERNI